MTKHIHIHVGTKDAPPANNSPAEKANRFIASVKQRSGQLAEIGNSDNHVADARNLASGFKKIIADAEAGLRLCEQVKG